MYFFIILPNQLFDLKYFPIEKKEECTVLLVEEEIYFGYREKRRLNFNRIKLAYHRATMKAYRKYLLLHQKSHRLFKEIRYIDFKQARKQSYLKPNEKYFMFDPVDHLFEKKVKAFDIHFFDTPNFLVSKSRLTEYFNLKKTKKTSSSSSFHAPFYSFMKKELSISDTLVSLDSQNRKKIPPTVKIPETEDFETNNEIREEAIEYVKKTFPTNSYGDLDSLYLYPITRSESLSRLKSFMKNKLVHFGDYQDAMKQSQPFLFHSIISPCLNIGLITPNDVLVELKKYKGKVKKNNYEGFLRQIIGWREFQRYTYLFFYKKMKRSNYFGNRKRLTVDFYRGTTGIDPVDDCIKMGFKYGYLHHILRLMVMSNYMNLKGIKPDECYRWFMEFSIDSYDWVMIQNVYSMGQFSDGGVTMRRPYISSSNYILKMSDYRGSDRQMSDYQQIKEEEKESSSIEDWTVEWDYLYNSFLKRNRAKLKGTFYFRLKKKK